MSDEGSLLNGGVGRIVESKTQSMQTGRLKNKDKASEKKDRRYKKRTTRRLLEKLGANRKDAATSGSNED